jgi:hypothetical protein
MPQRQDARTDLEMPSMFSGKKHQLFWYIIVLSMPSVIALAIMTTVSLTKYNQVNSWRTQVLSNQLHVVNMETALDLRNGARCIGKPSS